MIWDIQNQRVVESMGMAWDTGAPAWPYQASYLLLSTINAPAFVLAAPLFFLPHLEPVEARYVVLLPVILLWWWWVGTRLDFGILGWRRYQRPALSATFLAIAAVGLLYTGASGILQGVRLWVEYPPTRLVLLTRWAGPALWSVALAGGCLLAALRLVQKRIPAVAARRGHSGTLAYGVGFAAFVAVTTSLIGTAREPRVDPDSCLASLKNGCIHGTIADERGEPIRGIQVEVLPADKTDEERWFSSRYVRTDSEGKYSVNELDPGVYFVAVHHYNAPHVRQPFATEFYPGTESEAGAERVVVGPNSPVTLKQLRLRSLPLATIDVEVVWSGGTRPRRSNLLFHNLGYPNQATIGDVAPQLDDGTGRFTLPEGYDYLARAKVDCDGREGIESRESAVQHFTTRDGKTPRKLTFTILVRPASCGTPELNP